MDDVIEILDLLEKSCLLIDDANEITKHKKTRR